MTDPFRALVIEDAEGEPKAAFRELALSDLPDHDVLAEIAYSTLNDKDGLAVSGEGRIARRLTMLAGIDLSDTVVEPLSRLPDLAGAILAGEIRGRVVIDVAR